VNRVDPDLCGPTIRQAVEGVDRNPIPPGLVLFDNRLIGGLLYERLDAARALLNLKTTVGTMKGDPDYIYAYIMRVLLGDWFFVTPVYHEIDEESYRRARAR